MHESTLDCMFHRMFSYTCAHCIHTSKQTPEETHKHAFQRTYATVAVHMQTDTPIHLHIQTNKHATCPQRRTPPHTTAISSHTPALTPTQGLLHLLVRFDLKNNDVAPHAYVHTHTNHSTTHVHLQH